MFWLSTSSRSPAPQPPSVHLPVAEVEAQWVVPLTLKAVPPVAEREHGRSRAPSSSNGGPPWGVSHG